MFKCTRCGEEYSEDKMMYKCEECDSVLKIKRDIEEPKLKGQGIRKYKEALSANSDIVTLDEGGTPLTYADQLSSQYDSDIYLKYEGLNPTGAFKDRGSALAITKALEYGYHQVTLASTGNMAASVAAYSSKARLKSRIFVPSDTSIGKMAQVLAYGGNLERVKGSFQDTMDKAWAETREGAYLAETGLNPYYLDGEKTVAYEMAYEMEEMPDMVVVPMGTGGLLSSMHWGFQECKELGIIDKVPRLIGAQAKACSPIVDAFNQEHKRPKNPVGAHGTIASSIHVKTPFNGHTAIEAMRETNGFGVEADDEHIVESILEMGKEGVFGEPASALPLAAIKKLFDPEEDLSIDEGQSIVLMVTGNGLKESELLLDKGIFN